MVQWDPKFFCAIAFYTTGLDIEQGETSTGGRLLHCWNTENQRNCHIFVSRIRTKPPIIMWFGALILLDLDKVF